MTPDETADLRAQLQDLLDGKGVTSLEDLFPGLVDGEESRLLTGEDEQ